MKTLIISILSFFLVYNSFACNTNNLPWLQLPACNSCVSSVEVVTYNNQDYIVFWGDNVYCADALTTVYDCQGNVFCLQGGFAGFNQCANFITGYTYQSTLWSQSIDCCIDPDLIDPMVLCPAVYDPVCGCDYITYPNSCIATNYNGVSNFTQGACQCDINNLPWLNFPDCDDCVSAVDAFEFNNNLYFVFWGDDQNCSDAITTVYDCQGNIFCQQGGIAGLQQCNIFFSNSSLVSNLWSYQTFCCPPYLDLSNQTVFNGLYQAAIQVRSAGNISSNNNVKFQAGNNVELYNGFYTPADANFAADIEDCQ